MPDELVCGGVRSDYGGVNVGRYGRNVDANVAILFAREHCGRRGQLGPWCRRKVCRLPRPPQAGLPTALGKQARPRRLILILAEAPKPSPPVVGH